MSRHRTALPLVIGALGVVFGDLGTSPIYAFTQSLSGGSPFARADVFGILSLITWSLIVVVSIKYVTFLMRADNHGEGGIFALLAMLLHSPAHASLRRFRFVVPIALFGAAALYGDGVITPAISVVSSIEGLKVWNTGFSPYVIPLAVLLLLGLFVLQVRGTGAIGAMFGPVMVIWFALLAYGGLLGIAGHPAIVRALDPLYAGTFVARHGTASLAIFGAIVLCLTGVEALYADISHFGRRPITVGWYAVVFPACLLNYFGQGALVLAHPHAAGAPFFLLYPHGMLLFVVLIAAAATIIASQSLIAAVFTLTHQAIELGFLPRLRVVHTSPRHIGRIFIPAVNVVLAIGCVLVVLGFRTSAAMGAAFGLAVTITMLATTLTYFALTRVRYGWPIWRSVALTALFMLFEIPFLLGNLGKLPSGAWLSLAIAVCMYVSFIVWHGGRERILALGRASSVPLHELRGMQAGAEGAAEAVVVFTPYERRVPFLRANEWLQVQASRGVLVGLHLQSASVPYVAAAERCSVEQCNAGVYYAVVRHGFMEQLREADVLSCLENYIHSIKHGNITYLLAKPAMPENRRNTMAWLQAGFYRWMATNAAPIWESLEISPERTVFYYVEAAT